MRTVIVFIGYASLVLTAQGADCDCTHFPIKPEACVRVCQAALLQKASKEDLTNKVKLSPDAADALMANRDIKLDQHGAGAVKTFSTLKDEVPDRAYTEITTKLDNLKDSDFKALAQKYGTSKVEVKPDGEISIPKSANSPKMAK
jgi:hypothetical protein